MQKTNKYCKLKTPHDYRFLFCNLLYIYCLALDQSSYGIHTSERYDMCSNSSDLELSYFNPSIFLQAYFTVTSYLRTSAWIAQLVECQTEELDTP